MAAVMAFCASAATAQISTIVIRVNESGVGTIDGFSGHAALSSTSMTDPGPGGLSNALTFNLGSPPGLVAGDLQLEEGVDGPIGDVIRFNPTENSGSLVFYSTDLATASLADIGLPTSRYTNLLTLFEVPVDGGFGVVYTPTAGQPGFVAGASAPVQYRIISDAVPEPATWALMILGFGAAGASLRRRHRGAALAA